MLRTPLLALSALTMSLLLAGCAGDGSSVTTAPSAGRVDVKMLAINDFHGNLKPGGSLMLPDPADHSKTVKVNAGGAEYLATWLKTLKAKNPNNVVVAAGDLIGASPLLSALFHDEPTIEAMNEMGLEFNAVGNHEFDEGAEELVRMQNGGCHPVDGCVGKANFGGAKFKYLAANVVNEKTGKTLFPAYLVKEFQGIKVAFIGMTLKGTPSVVSPAGVAGLKFRDEAETVNQLVPELKAQGINAIVVLVHEGGAQTGGLSECKGMSGAIVDITKNLNPAVDIVVSGHTHQAYNCEINGKLVTSANQYGRVVSEIDFTLDPITHDVVKRTATNIPVTNNVAMDSVLTSLIERYDALVKPLESRVAGQLAGGLFKAVNASGEAILGNVIADAQLAATSGATFGNATIAFLNPGGARTDLVPDASGNVTYGQLFTVQPFGNSLVTMTLTGAQIKELLEQQFVGYTNNQPIDRVLHPSQGFTYRWDSTKPAGQRVDTAGIKLNDVVLDLQANYRVTVNNFMANGGDGFTVLNLGIDRLGGAQDIDALEKYIKANSPLAVPALGRVVKTQ
ncbi:bifunctional metallophosphatase/5'-nucleotidase [Chitinimonas sp. BJB300]|uniref:bifunctional metallophosphatase/5'-nucleotidase n=1 Tax=Chitinimonas sp. BJB300 TaxID=1559339 RepID=UPI000C0E8D4B|nr:bifunctional metallophosphatase/5'-nucleotidase [Chitinimonas sp. BJB300]PHV12531.1 bifunctional metallophosphatase/5'-nucleotidase [Chitinimonas sp. BJB300]TSJ91120.1 bifunctional metallophosphatase/5'-nucleotidase [Chitinimonas sp. BJB300]